MRDSDEQSVSFRNKKAGPSALRRVDLGQSSIVICVGLLDDIDLARATDRVNAMTLHVIKDIVGIAGDIDLREHLTRICVEYDEFRWQAASDKQSVIRFIQRHRKISEG